MYLKIKLAVILLLFSLSIQAQKKGYIVKGDSTLIRGAIEFSSKRPNLVKFYRSNSGVPVNFSPEDVSEFGFIDSTRFYSRRVNFYGVKKRIFLEQLTKGEVELYKSLDKSKQPYIQLDSLVAIDSSNVEEIIQKYVQDIPLWKEQLPFIRPKHNSLVFFARNYNAKNIISIPFGKLSTSSGRS